ncbi:MAG TPA: hypothetical protein VI318_10430 [Baekduia sp.]
MIEITRRSLLRTGATATAVAVVGVRPWSAAAASAATPVGPLRRSDYAGLTGSDFTVVDGTTPASLRLVSVEDVQGAVGQASLRGSEDAFALSFTGDAALVESGIHTLEHAQLGRFDLFVSPVGAEAERGYEVVIDRSVGAPPSPPRAPEQPLAGGREEPTGAAAAAVAAAAAPSAPAATAPTAPVRPKPRAVAPLRATKVIRAATIHRLGHGARVDLTVLAATKAKTVHLRLDRAGKPIAHATRTIHNHRASIVLRTARHLPAGTYTLVVTTVATDGTTATQRRRMTVR